MSKCTLHFPPPSLQFMATSADTCITGIFTGTCAHPHVAGSRPLEKPSRSASPQVLCQSHAGGAHRPTRGHQRGPRAGTSEAAHGRLVRTVAFPDSFMLPLHRVCPGRGGAAFLSHFVSHFISWGPKQMAHLTLQENRGPSATLLPSPGERWEEPLPEMCTIPVPHAHPP